MVKLCVNGIWIGRAYFNQSSSVKSDSLSPNAPFTTSWPLRRWPHDASKILMDSANSPAIGIRAELRVKSTARAHARACNDA
jgi:hypothetical protein